jgi:VWFA-related protein
MSSPLRREVVAVALSAGLAWTALAAQAPPQQPPQQPPPPRPPVFRAGAVLVTVDVYPQRSGKVVEGLTAADFQLMEDGKPQVIDGVELVRVERTLSDAERRDPNTVREMWSLAADPRNRVFVVYLDSLHVSIEGSYNIRRPLIDTLNGLIAPNDLFALMTPNLQARHLAFGRRMQSVEEQLTRYWPWGERGRMTTDLNDPVEDALTRCFQYEPIRPSELPKEWFVEDDGVIRRLDYVLIDRRREDRTITSLEDLVVFLTNRREARTVMVLVSDGWRLYSPDRRLAEEAAKAAMGIPGVYGGATGSGGLPGKPSTLATTSNPSICNQELVRLADMDNAQRFRALLTQAGRANISVYPVAASGLAAFDTSLAERTTATGTGISPLVVDRKHLVNRIQSLRTLAENTDGVAVVNTNDLAAGMRRIVDDVSSYYLLTYYSSNTRHDGRYRKIEVTAKRPDLTIRARRGYMAPTDADVAASKNPTVAAAASVPAAPASDAVPVDAVFGPLSRLRTGAEVFTYGVMRSTDLLMVSVELGSSQLVSGPFAKGADVDVAAAPAGGGPAVVTVRGARIEPGTRGVVVRLPLPPAAAAPGQASLMPGPWLVTATIGSGADRLQERFEIKAGTGKLLGDPMPYRATPAPSSPIRAVADFLYRRTERIHVEWPLLAAVDRKEARLIGRNGQLVPLPVALSERTDNGQTVIAADVTLAPLAAADYAIELVVGQGANSERRYVAFRVVQ